MRNLLLNTSYCNKNQNRQRPASKTVYVCACYPSKLGLHPKMLPSIAYIIKQLKNYNKDKNRFVDACISFVVCIFMFHILTNWYFNTHLTSPLNLADLHFLFIMPVTAISTITFYLNMLVLNFGM